MKIYEIKKTMCHHTINGVVCDRHLFLGLQNSLNFDSAQEPKFLTCSEIKTNYHPHPEGCGLISDMKNILDLR